MTVVVGLDPGLANFGACAIEVPSGELVGADVWRSKKGRGQVTADRADRVRRLTRWLEAHIRDWGATTVAAEAPAGGRGQAAIAAMYLVWGAVIALAQREVERPLLIAHVDGWRRALTGQRYAADDAIYSALDRRGGVDVRDSLLQRGVPRGAHVHALDALGVARWASAQIEPGATLDGKEGTTP